MNTISAAVEPDAASVPDQVTYDMRHLWVWRRYLGLNRHEVARMSGVSHSMLVTVEYGQYRLSGRLANKLARALDVPAGVLVRYLPDERRARPHARRAATRFALWRMTHGVTSHGGGDGNEAA